MKTNDELITNFGSGQAPTSDDPHMTTTAAVRPTRERTFPFSGEPDEYLHQSASNLPMSVDQQTILAENRQRWGNIGPADSPHSAPTLAGTQGVEKK
ncbi:MAG: hypothetical protein WB562_06330 [Candidatus Sulfotelmatobacter sp.]